MGKRPTDRSLTPAERAELVRNLVGLARHSVGLARAQLAATERVAAAAEEVQSAKIPDVASLRRALDELDAARRELGTSFNDARDTADCVLDAFEVSTRHIRR